MHNETATGVTSDIGAVRKAMDAAKHPALLFVDSVSGLASIDFRMDEWKVDVAITGSQKGFMLPAGLGLVCVSPRALELGKTARLPRCYWSYEDMVKANGSGYFPYTPSIPMLYGLRESLTMLLEEGLEQCLHPASPAGGGLPPGGDRVGTHRCAPRRPSGTATRSARSWCRPASTVPT